MSDDKKIVDINEGLVRQELGQLVGSVEDTLNTLLDEEADQLCNAQKCERSPQRTDSRAGHYKRGFETKVGKVELNMPKLRHDKQSQPKSVYAY